jgi:predicted ATPase
MPRYPTSFVGRLHEARERVEDVIRHQLVTLVGMGGIGKTRLADEMVRQLRDELHQFTDGIFFVDLVHPSDNSEQQIVTAIAAAGRSGQDR